MEESIAHHRAHYMGVSTLIVDGYSWVLGDYTALNIFDQFSTDAGQNMLQIVDPYAF